MRLDQIKWRPFHGVRYRFRASIPEDCDYLIPSSQCVTIWADGDLKDFYIRGPGATDAPRWGDLDALTAQAILYFLLEHKR
jgi:hypothetical protein